MDFLKLTTVKASRQSKRAYRPRLHAEVTSAGMGAQTDEEAHDKHHDPDFEPEYREGWFMKLVRKVRPR